MKIEYEIRVLEIDEKEIIQKVEELGAKKVGEFNQKRYVYDTKPKHDSKWIRLRTDGKITTLAYKNVEKDTIDGTKEIEFKVEDFEKTNEFLEQIGFNSKGYQENRRIQYIFNDTEIDIDSWPMIPTYMEIEGENEQQVLKTIELLNIDKEKITALNCQDIYKKIYNIDIDKINVLKF